jgi:hypothetical protein
MSRACEQSQILREPIAQCLDVNGQNLADPGAQCVESRPLQPTTCLELNGFYELTGLHRPVYVQRTTATGTPPRGRRSAGSGNDMESGQEHEGTPDMMQRSDRVFIRLHGLQLEVLSLLQHAHRSLTPLAFPSAPEHYPHTNACQPPRKWSKSLSRPFLDLPPSRVL